MKGVCGCNKLKGSGERRGGLFFQGEGAERERKGETFDGLLYQEIGAVLFELSPSQSTNGTFLSCIETVHVRNVNMRILWMCHFQYVTKSCYFFKERNDPPVVFS